MLILKSASGKRIGRKKLVKLLGVGEGSVRTILKKLGRDRLVESEDYRGQALTKKGESLLKRKYISKFTAPEELGGRLSWLPSNLKPAITVVLLVRKSAGKVGSGMRERDISMKAGSDHTLILACRRGRLAFPGKSGLRAGDYVGLSGSIGGLKVEDEDVVVITSGKTKASAEDGALSVALDLTGS